MHSSKNAIGALTISRVVHVGDLTTGLAHGSFKGSVIDIRSVAPRIAQRAHQERGDSSASKP